MPPGWLITAGSDVCALRDYRLGDVAATAMGSGLFSAKGEGLKAFTLFEGVLVGISFLFSGIDLLAFSASFHGDD